MLYFFFLIIRVILVEIVKQQPSAESRGNSAFQSSQGWAFHIGQKEDESPLCSLGLKARKSLIF